MSLLDNDSEFGNFWYLEKDQRLLANAVTQHVCSLRSDQKKRQNDNIKWARLYGTKDLLGFGSSNSKSSLLDEERITYNVIRSVADTIASKITTKKPRPFLLTEGEKYSARRKARDLQSFIDGCFYQTKIEDIAPQVYMDALIFGTGFMKVYEEESYGPEQSKICIERVFPDDITIDDHEGIYGNPRSMYQTMSIDRQVLMASYPKKKKDLKTVQSDSILKGMYSERLRGDILQVCMAWHLPSHKGAQDGRYVVCVGDVILVDEVYEEEDFPFIVARWNRQPIGFWGEGVCSQLMGIQIQMNVLLDTLTRSLRLHSVPKWLIESGSKIIKSHLDNTMGGVIEYSGIKPTLEVFQTVSRDLLEQLANLYSKAYEIIGVSQLSAQMKKPSGLDSGIAIRNYYDMESERHGLAVEENERIYISAAQKIMALVKRIAETKGDYVVTSSSKYSLKKIKWSDIAIDESEVRIKVHPTNFMPTTPSGKLQTLTEMSKIPGLLSPRLLASTLDYPDLEATMSRITAPIDLIEQMIERMIVDGIYDPPEKYMDLEGALEQVQLAYNEAKLNDVDDQRLELLRTFMSQTETLIKQMTPPQEAPAPSAPPAAALPLPQ